MKTKDDKKSNFWLPRQGASTYFSSASDVDFKTKHPVGYVFLVILGIIALFGPDIIFSLFVFSNNSNINSWIMLGWLGGFIFGIGLFNLIAIIINQYLGRLVSICSFIIGVLLMGISIFLL